MKKILVTGMKSYIGRSFEEWIKQWPDDYQLDFVSLRSDDWKKKQLEGYDVILHLAAIVHIKENNSDKYSHINRDLTREIAIKAKKSGVRQFIFLSTMGVYGMETGYITKDTRPNPKSLYAKSKLEAEKLLWDLEDDNFKIAILRPPIVYGKNCGGNYRRLAKLALKTPIFPNINNKRSMIFIDNLSEFIRLIIDNNLRGLYFPQNKEYVNTTSMMIHIANMHNKKIGTTNLFNPLIYVGIKLSPTFGKVFGTFQYAAEISDIGESYEICNFAETIRKTESFMEAR